MENRETTYEPWERQGSLSDGEFWNAIRLDNISTYDSSSAPIISPVGYSQTKDICKQSLGGSEAVDRDLMWNEATTETALIPPGEMAAPKNTEHLLTALLDQVNLHGSLSDGEFVDGASRILDACPSPRLLGSPSCLLVDSSFDSLQVEVAPPDDESPNSIYDLLWHERKCLYNAGDDIAENLPDLIFMQKASGQGTLELRGGGPLLEEENSHHESVDFEHFGHPTDDQARELPRQLHTRTIKVAHFDPPPQPRCACGSGCHLEKLSPCDCTFQAEAELAQATERSQQIRERTREKLFELQKLQAIESPYVESHAKGNQWRECNREHHAGFESDRGLSEHIYSSTHHPYIPGVTGNLMACNPPTPHPKVFGDVSDSDLHVRIAQILDELRILNLALAKRKTKTANSEEPNAASPEVF